MSPSLYELLGLTQSASDAEILTAFQQLRQRHATRSSGISASDAKIEIEKLDEAYRTLSDYGRRSAYDASLQTDIAPPRLEIAIREPRWSSHKILLIVIGVLITMGLTLDISFSLLNNRTTASAEAEAHEGMRTPA